MISLHEIFYLIIRKIYRFIKFRIIPEKYFIRHNYKKVFGEYPNLNNPQTFNEKLQWKKLYDRRDIYTTIADKYAVRKYIADRIGDQYLVPIYGVYDEVNKIPFDELTKPCIIKPTHLSNRVKIVRDINNLDLDEIKKECKNWLEENFYYYGKEWQYKNIEPQIIIEKLLIDDIGDLPLDYKFHCFNGNVYSIQVDIGRFRKHKRNFYDKNWNLLTYRLIYEKGKNIRKPPNLTKMIELAQILSRDFNYIRVDLYNINKQIYFGELTETPESGFGKFFPTQMDNIWGNQLIIE